MSTLARTAPNSYASEEENSPEPTSTAWRSAAVLLSHFLVDVYSFAGPALLGLLEVRCQLSAGQAALLLGLGSLTSGVAQPLTAVFSDRWDSRVFGSLGLGVASVCLCMLGAADSFATLLVIYMIGMVGVGMFHPVGASSLGQLLWRRRSAAMSAFFVAGMLGGITGSFWLPRLAAADGGFGWLRVCMIPGLVVAILLKFAIGAVSHRAVPTAGHGIRMTLPKHRWRSMGLLYVSSALRFSVNLALTLLFVRWAQQLVTSNHPGWTAERIASEAAPSVGSLNSFCILGMAIGGIASGLLVKPGREKWPMVLVPIAFAPAVAFLPRVPLGFGYLLATAAGMGFASMVPVGMALAQRLLPNRTSLASGLMLGGAWAAAMIGPLLAEQGIQQIGLPATFMAAAVTMAISGLVLIPLRDESLRVAPEL